MSISTTEALIEAILLNDLNTVSDLLAKQINPNDCLDSDLVTPLHFAAQNNFIDIAKKLIRSGANVNATTAIENSTPYDIACLHQHEEMKKLLLNYSK
tara:strand:+ start:881 stop:1174 length:294 start_codon:yes stop_codon:yes gene_type:complete